MEINIFASSDVHGFIDNYDYVKNENCSNSLAAINTAFKNSNSKNKIIVDNGDMIQGNFIGNFNENIPHPAIDVMNKIGYSIWNLGNHEFNYGVYNLKNVIKQFNNTTLMANSNDDFFKKYKILNINGINIAFVGVNTPLINKFESKEALGDLIITDPVIELENILEDIKDKSDVIIGLFHMGLKNENSYLNSGALSIIDNLSNNNLLDVVICGHTHQKIEEFFYKDILITQPFVYGKNLSKIKLVFDNNKLISKSSSLIDIESFEPDENIIEYYKTYHEKIIDFTHKTLGYIKNAEENRNVDLEDSPLAHFITDIMLSFSNADICSFQIDNTKAYLSNGPLKRFHMSNLYSYSGGEVSTYKIKGFHLKKYMEWSASYFDKIDEKVVVNEKRSKLKYKTFDIFGNLLYEIDLDEEIGNRVKNIKYTNGKEVKDDDSLIIAINEYRMNFLMSEKGPLSGNEFEKLSTTKYQDEFGHKHGTISGDLAEQFFEKLEDKTYIANNNKFFRII